MTNRPRKYLYLGNYPNQRGYESNLPTGYFPQLDDSEYEGEEETIEPKIEKEDEPYERDNKSNW